MSFTAYAQLRLPQVAEAFSHLGFPAYFRVELSWAKLLGVALQDPSGLFNSSLDGNVRRAIDINESDKVDEAALKDLIRSAVALNLVGKSKQKSRRARSKRAD